MSISGSLWLSVYWLFIVFILATLIVDWSYDTTYVNFQVQMTFQAFQMTSYSYHHSHHSHFQRYFFNTNNDATGCALNMDKRKVCTKSVRIYATRKQERGNFLNFLHHACWYSLIYCNAYGDEYIHIYAVWILLTQCAILSIMATNNTCVGEHLKWNVFGRQSKICPVCIKNLLKNESVGRNFSRFYRKWKIATFRSFRI